MKYLDMLKNGIRHYVWNRDIDIPDRTLCVGPYEVMEPLPKQKILSVPKSPIIEMSKDTMEGYEGVPGRGPIIPDEKKFFMEGYLGPSIVIEGW